MDDCQPKTNIDPGNQILFSLMCTYYVKTELKYVLHVDQCLLCDLVYIEASLIEADIVQGLQWRVGSSTCISSTMIMTRFEVHYESRSYTFMALFVFSNRHWKIRVRDLKETIFDLLVLAITLISINDWTL